MKYKIVSDSTANIIELNGIPFCSVPLKIRTDEKEFSDDESTNVAEMVDYLKGYKGKSGTACPAPDEYIEAFGDADYIFCITITSALSGSYNAARIAKEEYESSNPGKKVFVIDSLSTGPEMGLIIEKLEDMILSGLDYEDICKEITEYSKYTHLVFILESLTNLANNGRVSHSVAKISGILGIRLIGKASNQGTLEPTDKSRGEKKSVETLYKNMKDSGYNGGKVIINHCDGLAKADTLKEKILADFPQADIKIDINRALCSFYAERGGILVGFEGNSKY